MCRFCTFTRGAIRQFLTRRPPGKEVKVTSRPSHIWGPSKRP